METFPVVRMCLSQYVPCLFLGRRYYWHQFTDFSWNCVWDALHWNLTGLGTSNIVSKIAAGGHVVRCD